MYIRQWIAFDSNNIRVFAGTESAKFLFAYQRRGIYRCRLDSLQRCLAILHLISKLPGIGAVWTYTRIGTKSNIHPGLYGFLEIQSLYLAIISFLCQKILRHGFTGHGAGNTFIVINICNQVSAALTHHAYAFIINHSPVFYRCYTCADRILDAFSSVRVRGYTQAFTRGFFYGCVNFFITEISCCWLAAVGKECASGDDFDEVYIVTGKCAYALTNLVYAIRHAKT